MKNWERIVFGCLALFVLAAAGLLLHELDMPMARFVRSFNIEAVNYSGDLVATVGKGSVLAGAFILAGLLGWILKRDRLRDLGIRGTVAIIAIGAATQSFKHLIGRPRPRFAHGDEFQLAPSMASGLDSFPSGHAANAFGTAAVIAWFAPGLRVPVYLLAGLVGISRVVRGSHFPTDVFAGAVLGVLIGSLAAAGFKRWWDEALPRLLLTGIPLAVAPFLIFWIALHQAPDWSQDIGYVAGGAALILGGSMLRGFAAGPERGSYWIAGRLMMLLGLAVACGPWWAGLLMLAALAPAALVGLRTPAHEPSDPTWVSLPVWGREALATGSALLIVAVIRSVKGLVPLN